MRMQPPAPSYVQGIFAGRKGSVALPCGIRPVEFTIIDKLHAGHKSSQLIEGAGVLRKTVIDIGIIIHITKSQAIVHFLINE